jgi:hypothetical protein
MTFLEDVGLRPLVFSKDIPFKPIGLALGEGSYALEIAVVRSGSRPTATDLRSVWNVRSGGRPVPLLIVALYANDTKSAICGPEGQPPPVYQDLEINQVERICIAALETPDRHRAFTMLQETLPEVGSKIPGVLNEGLLATHELEYGVPLRNDWEDAINRSRSLLARRSQRLLRDLGYEVHNLAGPVSVLVAEDTKVAIGLFLNRSEAFDLPNERFSNLSPIAYALARADKERLPYVVALAEGSIRLYPVQAGVGVGQRGRTETFVQLHLDLLSEEKAGYLWLLFSAQALLPKGTFEQILADSSEYSADLGSRLRERIYNEVIPQLAQSIAHARNLDEPTTDELDDTYQMALTMLFRLLFVAYAEDKGLLPYKTNQSYKSRSLNQKTQELLRMEDDNIPFDSQDSMWREIQHLFDSIDKGQRAWGIPPYNGGLFASDPDTAPIGAAIKSVSLTDEQFGPALRDLLIEDSPDGVRGAVDFRSLSVREFGTIYEGLLQSELSVAQTDLGLDKDGLYVPVEDEKRVVVHQGEVYLHNASGARKSTGSYYTKSFAVEHLLDHALEPALDDHLARLKKLDERAAGEAFFDFRVADIAMGSGHFLVAAIDRIERRFSTYLADNPLPDVTNELTRLRERAKEVTEQYGGRLEIEDTLLLRRQIARRCIYGVDMNPMAVDLSRLSIWIHTFVPGLPLSLLDYNLVRGNSLVGIATLQEAKDILAKDNPLFSISADKLLGDAQETLSKIGRLADADASEIARAREAYEAAHESLVATEALFDILTASRIKDQLKEKIDEGQSTHWMKDEVLKELPDSELHQIAKNALEAISPFHFPIAFPQVFLRKQSGFDVILGNPPWEEATLEEDRFWTRYVPGLHSMKQRQQETMKAEWREQRPDLVTQYEQELAKTELMRKVLVTGPFPGMGTGDPDLYKGFVWRFWALINRPYGRTGVVLPRSVFSAKGASEFRSEIFQKGIVEDMTNLVNNRQWIFDDVHPQYTVTLFSLRRQKPKLDTTLPMRGPYRSLDRYRKGMQSEPIKFKLEEVLGWTETVALPLLPDEEAAEVFAQMRKAPSLNADDKTSWRARPYAELHATNDKKYMELVNNPDKGWWPVFKGASFDIWKPDTGTYYAWAKPEIVLERLNNKRVRGNRSRNSVYSEFSKEWATDKSQNPAYFARIAFRDISRTTDTRTIRAALIPPKVAVQNTAPMLIWPRGDEKDEAYLLGVFCSIPLDWYSRRFVEIHMNFHILNGLPIPRPKRKNPLWQRVVELAGRLAAVDDRYADWADAVGVEYGSLDPDDKDDMIFELDAVVAHLYGLSAGQLTHIFETFHEGWDYKPRLNAVMKHFNSWKNRV